MKRRVRTAAMPFLLSVFVLCVSKTPMLVQLLKKKVAALSNWQLPKSCPAVSLWNSRNLYTNTCRKKGIVIVLTRRIGPRSHEVCVTPTSGFSHGSDQKTNFRSTGVWDTRKLLGGTEEKSISPALGHWLYLTSLIFDSLWPLKSLQIIVTIETMYQIVSSNKRNNTEK